MTRAGGRVATIDKRARARIPGGTSSPARDVGPVGADLPVLGASGRGARLTDVEGRTYIDYLQAFGPGIVGHGHAGVRAAVAAACADGPLFGLGSMAEIRLAEELARSVRGVEMVRFTASGTEAVMAAVRLARAVTGRRLLVKFDAGYHGHADVVLGDSGSAAAHAGHAAGSAPAGVPAGVVADTHTLPWNEAASLSAFLERQGAEVAAVIVEPVAGNIGIVRPEPEFVEALNSVRRYGACLIADEVVSAFRFRYGDAQSLVGLQADLTCMGKIVGGGLPIGAYGGATAFMERLAPIGDVFQAGTFAGHPVACAAGLATLRALRAPGAYERLDALGAALEGGLREAAASTGMAVSLNRVGGALTLWPGRDETVLGPVRTRADVEAAPADRFAAMYRGLRARGVLLAASRFEAWLLTLAHDADDVAETVAAARSVFAELGREDARGRKRPG